MIKRYRNTTDFSMKTEKNVPEHRHLVELPALSMWLSLAMRGH